MGILLTLIEHRYNVEHVKLHMSKQALLQPDISFIVLLQIVVEGSLFLLWIILNFSQNKNRKKNNREKQKEITDLSKRHSINSGSISYWYDLNVLVPA